MWPLNKRTNIDHNRKTCTHTYMNGKELIRMILGSTVSIMYIVRKYQTNLEHYLFKRVKGEKPK